MKCVLGNCTSIRRGALMSKQSCLSAAVVMLMLGVSSQAIASETETTKEKSDVADDIVVTATRVETLASKTPIALTALSGDQLRDAGVTDPTSLAQQVPGLQINRAQGGLQIAIRGISSYDFTAKGDPSAAFLLDGVYIARRQAQDSSFYDVQRVEVLRGPQGTLYGRNTTAGLVNVITTKPENEFGFSSEFTYGNYDARLIESALNVPVGERLAFRLSGVVDQRKSYLVDRPNAVNKLGKYRDNAALRGQVLFRPTDQIEILLRGDYAWQDGDQIDLVSQENFYEISTPTLAPAPVLTPNPTNNPVISAANLSAIAANNAANAIAFDAASRVPLPASRTSEQRRQLSYDLPSGLNTKNRIWGFGGELNWDFNGATMTYVGSHREFKQDESGLFERGGFALPQTITGNFKQDSHELRFALDNGGPLELQGGAYYFKEKSRNESLADSTPAVQGLFLPQFNAQFLGQFGFAANTPISSLPQPLQAAYNSALASSRAAAFSRPLSGFSVNPVINESYAFFGQSTYSLTDSIRLTLGARYSHDKKSQDGYIASAQAVSTPNQATDVFQLSKASSSSSKVTWRAGVDFDINPSSIMFATISTGYKAGGFNNGCSAADTALSNTGLTCSRPPASFSRPDSELYYKPETLTSYEVGFKTGFIDNALRVNGTAFFYDYKNLQLFRQDTLDNSPLLIFNAPKANIKGIELEAFARISSRLLYNMAITYTDATYGDLPLFVSSALVQPNFSGKPLDRTPKFVATAGIHYRLPVGPSLVVADLRTRLSGSYIISDFNNAIQFRQSSFTKTDASLTYNAPDDKWFISGFVRNIEDTVELTYILGGGLSPPSPLSPNGPRYIVARGSAIGGTPRTYGLRIGFKY
jgi:iron complex outermembrane recepter protein